MLGLQALYIAIETGGLLHTPFHLYYYFINSLGIAQTIFACHYGTKCFRYFHKQINRSIISVALSLVLLRPLVKWNTVLEQLGLSSCICLQVTIFVPMQLYSNKPLSRFFLIRTLVHFKKEVNELVFLYYKLILTYVHI